MNKKINLIAYLFNACLSFFVLIWFLKNHLGESPMADFFVPAFWLFLTIKSLENYIKELIKK